MEAYMKTLFISLVVLTVASSTAFAVMDEETYNYSCVVNGQTHPLRVDATKGVIEWMGYKYTIILADPADNCGRVGWHATGYNTPVKAAFDFCTATKGYAFFKKPTQDKTAGDFHVQCRQKIAG
jgi:hypothetical protein